MTSLISDNLVQGQGEAGFRHRAKSVQAASADEDKGCNMCREDRASACPAPAAHRESSRRGTGSSLCQDPPERPSMGCSAAVSSQKFSAQGIAKY